MLTKEEVRAKVKHWNENTTPAEKEAMWAAQRESFKRAFAPCEHGEYDWETCPECLAKCSRKDQPND